MKGSVSTWSYSDQGKANHEAIFGKDKPKTGGKRRYVVRDGEVVEALPEVLKALELSEYITDAWGKLSRAREELYRLSGGV